MYSWRPKPPQMPAQCAQPTAPQLTEYLPSTFKSLPPLEQYPQGQAPASCSSLDPPSNNYYPRNPNATRPLHSPIGKPLEVMPASPPTNTQTETLHRSWSVIPLPGQGSGRGLPDTTTGCPEAWPHVVTCRLEQRGSGREKGAQSGPSDPPETCHRFFKGKRVRLVVLQNLQQNHC